MGGRMPSIAHQIRRRLPPAGVVSLHARRVASTGPLNRMQRAAMLRDPDPQVRSVAEQLVAAPRFDEKLAQIEMYREYLASADAAAAYDVPLDRMQSLARVASKSPRWARLIFDLVVALKPQRVLEMGTAVGISGAYIAAGLEANGSGTLVTIDSRAKHCTIARRLFADLGLEHRVEVVEGRFDRVVDGLIDTGPPFDFVFKDGDHSEAATVDWFDSLAPRLATRSAFLLDDIRRDDGMTGAWKHVQRRDAVTASIDFFGLGLVLLTQHSNGSPHAYRYGVR